MQHFDVAIVGNGVLGSSITHALSDRSADMTIAQIGPSGRSGAATKAAGAMLGVYGEVSPLTLTSPEWRHKFDLGKAAADRWPRWIAGINDRNPAELHLDIGRGTFIILNTRSGRADDDSFRAIAQMAEETAEPIEFVDPQEVPGLEPMPDSRPERAMFLPNEGFMNSAALLAALDGANFSRSGVSQFDDFAQNCSQTGGQFRIETAAGETISADRLVIAAGFFSAKLIADFPDVGAAVPHLIGGVGTSLVFESEQIQIPSVVRTPNRAGACGIHVLPGGSSGLTYAGAGNILSTVAFSKPRPRDIYELMGRVVDQINVGFASASLDEVRVGHRPVTLDCLPLIGPTSIDGLWIATGTYRDGLHDSPMIAETIVRQILGQEQNTGPFAPERKPIETMSRAESIASAQRQLLDELTEHGIRLRHRFAGLISDALVARIEAIYNELETDLSIHPDILMMLAFDDSHLPSIRSWLARSG